MKSSEWKYSKDEILQLYLSMVPLGGNIEGLKSASMIYYQTPLERLNIAQLFDLILIPNNPNRLQPDRNPQPLYEERVSQSRRWIESGFFSREDSIVIANTAAIAVRQQLPRYAPHFCLRVKRMFNGESDIRSSLDLKTQKTVEALLSNHIRPWKKQGINNGAVVVIENASREIVAYAGSENFDDENAQGQVDAVKSLRSPGSTLKPFLVAMEMERGVLTPRTRLLDVPYDAEGFLAENYDGKYSGLVYVDEALRRSLNVPMIRLLKEAGVQPFIQLASDVGISSLQEQKRKLGLSMILGGCGVTLEELTAAYSTFPSGGIFIQPKYIHMGIAPSKEGREVFSASTAYMVTDILIGLDRPDLPNNFESSLNLPTIAFKTGTSYGRRDAWSIGYTAEFTIGVWLGNVTHKGNPDLVGGRVAAPLLVDIFNSISTRHQKIILPPPKDVKIREVCAHSGHIPTPQCSHLVYDLYSEKHTLNQICEVDKEYQVSVDGKEVFCSSCVGNAKYKLITFQDYPPELLSFWRSTGTSVAAVPPHHPSCTRLFAGEGPKIISPSEDMTYFIVSTEQKMTLQASSDLDVKEHIWYLDDKYLGRSNAGDKLFIALKDGEHAISCLDDKGRMNSTKIKIKYVL
ncbi:MAG: pbpC [Bacteroidetes bacterium]|nr:pbpC [Bacteroidota bacterium]